jgi:predicted RNase H-like HicB family nuclease
MDFYTIVLRESGEYWVGLCLENGLVGQGDSKETAIENLKEAIFSFQEARREDPEIHSSSLSIKELHEFLAAEGTQPIQEPLEMRALYA